MDAQHPVRSRRNENVHRRRIGIERGRRRSAGARRDQSLQPRWQRARNLFATGTRNPIGLHWYPGTDTLWAAVQERDALGDDLVPDYFTHIQQGGFYGWPYAYFGPHEDPRRKGEKPDLVKKTIRPDIAAGAHVAVLDFTFYTGKQFPAEYQGGAFLAFHGSWNRSKRVGQSIAFIPFQGRKACRGPGEGVPHRLDAFARPAGSLGPARRGVPDAGRQPAGFRRWRQEDLENRIQRLSCKLLFWRDAFRQRRPPCRERRSRISYISS